MNRYLQYITRQYWFRVVLTVLVCTVTARFGILQSYAWLESYLPFNPMHIMANPTLPYPRQTGTFYD